MSVGSRIRELRESKDISRSELAEAIGVTVGAVSNYENEVSSPKEPILFKIMKALKCDANYLFQDSINFPNMDLTVSVAERDLIKKYRDLDSFGQETVSYILNRESERVKNIQKILCRSFSTNEPSYLMTDAAQPRTDISVPEDEDTSDDDIMSAEDF
ncbi:helix-turn-helix transcriptional regulator [Dorea sp. NSJ-36]|uniref:Helix-turn-helix transcriptional regulator n=1 Tax=Dorea hominis TaxID=2763040 RepID=A0ABR7ETF4_9FIRM|nr:helix-turn-helix transcriptional regulator [Dorea hominis]MBC5663910.1 helix-turn-helix transcriptional regulator [Dorea hominis]DAE66656.1 MAG TPA: hypothetical protein [Caudoviricetes sp.]